MNYLAKACLRRKFNPLMALIAILAIPSFFITATIHKKNQWLDREFSGVVSEKALTKEHAYTMYSIQQNDEIVTKVLDRLGYLKEFDVGDHLSKKRGKAIVDRIPKSSGVPTCNLVDLNYEPPAGRRMIGRASYCLKDGAITIMRGDEKFEGIFKELNEIEREHVVVSLTERRNELLSHVGERRRVVEGQDFADGFQPSPLLNVPVILRKVNDHWEAIREDGKTPSAEEQKALDELAEDMTSERSRKIYGVANRSVGDTWVVDGADTDFLGIATITKGGVTLTLDKIEIYKGQECAFMSGDVDIEGVPGQVQPGTKGKMYLLADLEIIRSLGQQVDLLFKMTGEGRSEFVGDQQQMETSAKIESVTTIEIISPLPNQ